MVAVMLGAVMLDRRAITLRTAALAAILLLLTRPESLMQPGFQMSFAATVALESGFAVLDHKVLLERWPRWTVPVFTLVASSVIAGFATAPYAAATFNRFADYGLMANLLTVPVMGAVVMPAGALAVLLAPFGLAGVALWVMEWGVRWILGVAYWIAGLDGAVTAIPEASAWALPLITLGGLWLVAWRGGRGWRGRRWWRWACWSGLWAPRARPADFQRRAASGPDGAPRGGRCRCARAVVSRQ